MARCCCYRHEGSSCGQLSVRTRRGRGGLQIEVVSGSGKERSKYTVAITRHMRPPSLQPPPPFKEPIVIPQPDPRCVLRPFWTSSGPPLRWLLFFFISGTQ
eukprot:1135420-Prorocentrum_minimum.AAC.3